MADESVVAAPACAVGRGWRRTITVVPPYIHPTAIVDELAVVGDGTSIWHWTAVREGAQIGDGCTIGQGVYIDHDVSIGSRCKIQNGVSVYHGVTLADEVFVGPRAAFTNDRYPRATSVNWDVIPTRVERGASIGANATIVCGVTIGAGAMVAAGSVVTKDVPPGGLVLGNPARLVDYVGADGRPLRQGIS